MVTRPNDRALRGRNDVISSPGTFDASSGGLALADALSAAGRQAAAASAKAGDELTRQVIEVEKAKGRERALDQERTTLANGQEVPIVALRPDNTVASRAFNEGVMQVLPNRLRASMLRGLSSIEQQARGDPVAYRREANSFFQGFNQQVPEELRDDFELQFQSLSLAAQRRQEVLFGRRATQQARESNSTLIESLVATGEREAFGLVTPNPEERALAGANVQDQRELLEDALNQTDPMGDAVYSGDEQARIMKAFDQRVLTASALGGMQRAPDKEAYVEKWVDQQRKDGEIGFDMIDKVSARLMAELRRDNAANNVALREYRGEARGLVSVLDAGRTPPGLMEVRREGINMGAEAEVAAIDQAINRRDLMLNFVQQSPGAQAAEIRDLASKPEITPEELALQEAYTREHVATIKGIREAPYARALQTGMINGITPLGEFSPDELDARAEQKAFLEEQWGTRLPYLRPGEAESIVETVVGGDPDSALQILGGLNGTDPSLHEGIALQLSERSPAIARGFQFAGLEAGQANASLVIQGVQLLQAEGIGDLKPTATAMRTAIETTYGDIGAQDPRFFEQISATTEAIYIARLRNKGETALNEQLLQEAAEQSAGAIIDTEGELRGGVLEFGGRKTLPPAPGVTSDDFEGMLRSLSPQDLTTYSQDGRPPTFADGRAMTPEMLTVGIGTAANLGGFFTQDPWIFEPAGQGKYLLRNTSGAYMQTSAGPYVLDLGQAWADGIGEAEPPTTRGFATPADVEPRMFTPAEARRRMGLQ